MRICLLNLKNSIMYEFAMRFLKSEIFSWYGSNAKTKEYFYLSNEVFARINPELRKNQFFNTP